MVEELLYFLCFWLCVFHHCCGGYFKDCGIGHWSCVDGCHASIDQSVWLGGLAASRMLSTLWFKMVASVL